MNRFVRSAILLATLSPIALRAQTPAALEGAWSGQIAAGSMQIPLVFHFSASPAGLAVTMDSPSQGAHGIALASALLQGNQLTIEDPRLHAKYTGTVSPDGKSIHGTFAQGAGEFPLDLTPADTAALVAMAPKRPQTPQPPFPYASEDVSIPNPSAGNTLAGTLTLPPGKGPFAAVLLVAGSGPHDRDETIFNHKPFLVLADFLTRHGIAVLRVDKRGIGKSTGSYSTATTADFAADSEAAFAFLRARAGIDPTRVGVLGHSEGGLIAPMIAAKDPSEVAFVVLLAGPGTPGIDIIAQQTELIAAASGVPATQAAAAGKQERALLDIVVTESDPATRDAKLHTALAAHGVPEAQIASAIKQLTSPWYVAFLKADPAPALHKTRCPVLALAGSKDVQVEPESNLRGIREDLEAGGNTHLTEHLFPGLNHLFQTATTGAPSEYNTIEQTIDPAVLTTTLDWIMQQPARPWAIGAR